MFWSRRWRIRLLFFCASFLMFTTLWTFMTLLIIASQQQQLMQHQKYNNAQKGADNKNNDDNNDFMGGGIQVVVGHYNGKLPEEPKFNLSEEQINENAFAPIEGMGADGHAVRLSYEDELKSKPLFSINQFNLVASDRIPLNRSLPDVRKNACRAKVYPSNMPSTSVIIVFHNEAFSTLLRTVTSVINRSPIKVLKEIILVDDFSHRDFLQKELQDFTAKLPVKVHILRSPTRIGLIRARLMGAKIAQGQVLTFLDSHCECTEGWLEPLLSRIQEDRKVVICPVIDVINDKSFAYQRGIEMFWGGFNWNLQFRWYAVAPREQTRRKGDPTSPIRSPTMAGGLFAIDKSYFEEIGTYDSNMDIWGGENLELSFRVWQCGGKIEIAPCSHVGHVFRKASPHDFPDKKSGEILNTNLARVAEVWMDTWKHLFYKTSAQALELSKKINVTERIVLRQRLKCNDFQWYLNTIWPEHFMPMPGQFFGRIYSAAVDMCLEMAYVLSSFSIDRTEKRVSMGACPLLSDADNKFNRLQVGSAKQCLTSLPGEVGKRMHKLVVKQCTLGFDLWQFWIFSKSGQLKSDEHQCLQAAEIAQSWIVQLKECAESEREKWNYKELSKQFVHLQSGLCLDRPLTLASDETKTPTLQKCTVGGTAAQQWTMKTVSWID